MRNCPCVFGLNCKRLQRSQSDSKERRWLHVLGDVTDAGIRGLMLGGGFQTELRTGVFLTLYHDPLSEVQKPN